MLYNALNLEVAKFASKSDIQPTIAGVLFEKDKTVATDSFRMMEITTPASVKPKDFPVVNGKAPLSDTEPFIVPAGSLKGIRMPNGKVTKNLPILGHAAVGYVDKDRVEFMTTDLESGEVKSFQRVAGTFPDFSGLHPKGLLMAEVHVNGEYMAEILETLAKFSGLHEVTIKIYGNSQPIVMEARNDEQSGNALLMPIIQR